ncbi:MAG TPA: DegV family protein [Gaiellales bacterium]|nr:DegV family protein [Gaiellales bacterium]
MARGGQAALEANRDRINDLNVYPVPDGDTGSNLADTAARLADGLAEVPEGASPAAIAHEASRAALMGARGNSGVILSQMIRGFAESLSAEAGVVTAAAVARAFRGASDAAYGAVRQPVEGTMLTAIRAMADRAEQAAALPVDRQLAEVLQAGDETVLATRDMLPVLRDAGVVDAGAAGLVELVRGAVAGLQGREPATALPDAAAGSPAPAALHVEDSQFRYCTTFLVDGDGVDARALEREMEPLGDSLLVVGQPPTLKVHVHTDDPGAALSRAVGMGAISGVDINDMHESIRERSLRLVAPAADAHAVGTVALAVVSTSNGVLEAFREAATGVEVVPAGPSGNPSAGEIAAAIETAPAEGVLVLPNNPNVVLAAEHAVTAGGRPARVVPTQSPAAGILLARSVDPRAPLESNADRLAAINVRLRCGEVAAAVRDARMNGVTVSAGQYMAVVEGALRSAHDTVGAAVDALLADLAAGAAEVTVLRGADGDGLDSAWLDRMRVTHPDVVIDEVEGGQPLYPVMACAVPATSAPARRLDSALTAATTAIVLDSTADVGDPSARHENWSMVPLTVSFGERSYRDYVDINPEEFYERLRAARELPRTAAPSPGAWQSAFERLAGYDRILVLPVSSRVSASSQSAEIAAGVVDPGGRRIRVLETHSVSLGTLLLAEGLQRLLVRGVPENELMAWYDDARGHLGVVFSVETLTYLQRGGRIGRAQAMVGGMLGMRPILTIRDGEVAPLRRVRGRRRALAEFERFLREHARGSDVHVAVVHAAAPEAADQLVAMVRRVAPQAMIDHVGQLGAVVGTHGGPGTLGMAVLAQP